MSVSVSMPQLGESVTEGTVTRWLKKEGERVEVDEPLLEVSTDKVDTEIPSPASGILRSIAVDEDETVAVGARLAVIEDSETSDSTPAQTSPPAQDTAPPQEAAASGSAAAAPETAPASADGWRAPSYAASAPAAQTPGYAPPPSYGQPATPTPPPQSQPYATPAPPYAQPATQVPSAAAYPAAAAAPPAQDETAAGAGQPAADEEYPPPTPLPGAGEAPYVTPLVRKLAAEHAVNLETVTGTGVGGRIRKQDVIEAARTQRGSQVQAPQAPPDGPASVVPQQAQRVPGGPPAPGAQPPAATAAGRPAVVPSSLRGTTQRMSRPRQVIAQRMVESLQVSAQLTTVVETDVTAIARLRDRAKADFEVREGVKLTFLPFFALAAVEALKMHPKLNAVIDGDQVTYNDAEHLGVAVDTERGLMVPVIHNAGDLNIGGLARKIGDLAQRTRSGQVGPDELAGGTFTLTNTGSRGALFDTPIINQPQVAILGTGTVVRRPVVVEDPALGEVIAVRSMVYLALTYDHRLVDGADAARFLTTVKNRLEEGAFEAELGLLPAWMKVAVTGSSGLIGTALVASLRSDGHQVIRLVRRPPRSGDEMRWDPRAADGGLASSAGALDGIDACVHLAGAGVASRRWTSRYKAEIRASRVLGTRALAGALTRLGSPPATLVAASAIGWYGDTDGRDVDESAPAGKTFLARLVRDWEAAADPAAQAGIRVVHPRSGLVLTRAGGLLARLLPLARWGLCPRFASGAQAMSWISLPDEIGAIRLLLDRADISGPVNLTAPDPVTNSAFTAALNAAAGRRDLPWLRVPGPFLRLGLGESSVELLSSTRVLPKRLAAAGYQFRYPALPEALAAELATG